MHKSKNYDMATEVAMDKLMPKPIQITISMQGGGGLRGLGERPISSVYGRPIPRTIYRDSGGGLIQLAEGSTGSDPFAERYDVEEMSDKKLADELAREDILRSNISDEDLRESGLIRIRTRPWAISQGEEFEKRKGGDKEAHIRKLYYLSLNRLLDKVQQNADRTGNSPSYEKMRRIVDKGMTETFPEGYAEPIAPEYMGEYKMRLEPGDTQDFKDAYSGGGYPGPSFIPNKEQTAPVFESSSFEEIEDKVQSKNKGGGISNINKSININGQPHKLAWINPGEASALKAMGGSGKPGPMGIPSYEDEDAVGGDITQAEADAGNWGSSSGLSDEENYYQAAADYWGAVDSPGGTEDERDTGQIASKEVPSGITSTSKSSDTTYDSDVERDYQSGLTKEDFIQGRHSNKLNPYINALYSTGMITDQVGDYIASLSSDTIASMIEAYDKGYSYGGPMGTMQGLSRDQGTDYTKKLKLKKFAKELKDLRDKNLSQEELDEQKGELFSKYQDIAKEYGANITEGKRFKGMYSGLEEETADREGFMPKAIGAAAKYGLLPGSFATAGIAGIGNLLTDLFGVVGEFTTPEGQSYRLMEDGTLVEPDMYTPTQSDNDPMTSIKKRRPRPVAQSSTSEPEDDAPAKGTMAELLARRDPAATRAEGLASLRESVLPQVYPKEVIDSFNLEDVNIA